MSSLGALGFLSSLVSHVLAQYRHRLVLLFSLYVVLGNSVLELLLNSNSVLDGSSRSLVLQLMAEVIPSQRWGVPAGAPTSLTVHVKNGWLPLAPYGWRINSIGCFTGRGGGYSIVVLTQDNPSMIYGIDTVQAVARAVNQDLNPTAKSRVQPEPLSRSLQTPDESVSDYSVPASAGGS